MKLKFEVVLVILLVVIVMLSFIAFTNLPDTKLLRPRIGNKLLSNTQKTPSSSLSKLHPVKIISPIRGQQVPIGKNFTISGISIANTTSHCQVSIRVNGIKPYQPTTAAGPGGAADYSKWNFVLTSKYTVIKEGPNNKITAKYSCSGNPGIRAFYSANVSGIVG